VNLCKCIFKIMRFIIYSTKYEIHEYEEQNWTVIRWKLDCWVYRWIGKKGMFLFNVNSQV